MNDGFRFLVDTNVLVSVILSPNNSSRLALEKVFNNGFLLFSDATKSELLEVMNRKKFDKYVPLEKRMQFAKRLFSFSKELKVEGALKICRDPKDDKFLNLALEGKANFIISGDKDLLDLNPYNGISILSPSEFLIQKLD
ncbi:putative toxin-antitoxin system toxin component, PIN family [Aquiflexum sp.]|uniref:putative toxin-antitoxin system toxin component, PIN family n=1 Tax=Aquiflexum sp. TaxID=1872584 RepID=UPI00359411E3